jgi:outer membrane protein
MRVMLKAVVPVAALLAAWVVGASLTPRSADAQTAPAAAGTRVGFIDTQRVMAKSAAGVTAREALERDKAAMQKQVDTLQSDLAKLKDELEKKGQLLSPEVRKEKQDTMERKVRDLRRLADDFEKDLAKKDRELMVKFARDLQGVVQKVGKERGYTIIVDARAGLIYGAPEADLTEDVIKEFDAAARRAPGAASPTKP